MILHILDDEKFLSKAIKLFEDTFPGQNVFLVGIDPSWKEGNYSPKLNNSGVIYVTINTRQYFKIFKSKAKDADLLFFHNLYKGYKLRLGPYLRVKNKIAWYFWGAELYGLNPKAQNLMSMTASAQKEHLSFILYVRKQILANLKRRYFWYLFKRILRNKVDYILTNITEDIDLLNRYVDNKAQSGWFTYFSLDVESKEFTKVKKKHILIGNSSSDTNNHLDAFKLLESHNLNGKNVYIPLNYGDSRYRQIVIDRVKALFNTQAYPIVDFLTLKEYNTIIGSCSVVIMNHKRQQAFNTIMLAIVAGCKVFLREENTIYSCLKREGFYVFSIQAHLKKTDALDALPIKLQHYNMGLAKKLYAYPKVKKKIKEQILEIVSG